MISSCLESDVRWHKHHVALGKARSRWNQPTCPCAERSRKLQPQTASEAGAHSTCIFAVGRLALQRQQSRRLVITFSRLVRVGAFTDAVLF